MRCCSRSTKQKAVNLTALTNAFVNCYSSAFESTLFVLFLFGGHFMDNTIGTKLQRRLNQKVGSQIETITSWGNTVNTTYTCRYDDHYPTYKSTKPDQSAGRESESRSIPIRSNVQYDLSINGTVPLSL